MVQLQKCNCERLVEIAFVSLPACRHNEKVEAEREAREAAEREEDARRAAEFFSALDADGDGAIDDDDLRRDVDTFDADGDGTVSQEEVRIRNSSHRRARLGISGAGIGLGL